jgi:uncharacterized damage-inducible protein DinB
MDEAFGSRRDRLLAQIDEATGRLRARAASATPDEASVVPGDGGWTGAQVVQHVADFNRLLAAIVSGAVPAARAAAPDFQARPWNEILATLGGRFQAPRQLDPPSDVTRDDALAALDAAGNAVRAAFESLTDERAAMTMTHPRVGTITLSQVGDWIVAHTIRHNAQLKRVLGR